MLRHYGGIFVDYVYIDEGLLSSDTGLSVDDIYQTFIRLSKLHLISFIPRKHLPCVTFRTRRVDKEKVYLPRLVYEERRRHYEERMGAMLKYAEEESNCCRSRMLLRYFGESNCCRSRMLLRYFGEEADHDCGICDVCIRRNEGLSQPAEGKEALRNHILSQLREGPRNAYDLDLGGFNPALLEEVIDGMRASGEIAFDGPLLVIAKPS